MAPTLEHPRRPSGRHLDADRQAARCRRLADHLLRAGEHRIPPQAAEPGPHLPGRPDRDRAAGPFLQSAARPAPDRQRAAASGSPGPTRLRPSTPPAPPPPTTAENTDFVPDAGAVALHSARWASTRPRNRPPEAVHPHQQHDGAACSLGCCLPSGRARELALVRREPVRARAARERRSSFTELDIAAQQRVERPAANSGVVLTGSSVAGARALIGVGACADRAAPGHVRKSSRVNSGHSRRRAALEAERCRT